MMRGDKAVDGFVYGGVAGGESKVNGEESAMPEREFTYMPRGGERLFLHPFVVVGVGDVIRDNLCVAALGVREVLHVGVYQRVYNVSSWQQVMRMEGESVVGRPKGEL